MKNSTITTENTTNVVSKIIGNKVGFGFKPNKEFYLKSKINQKRFGMICSGKVSPTLEELNSICKYFNADLKDFI